MLNEDDRSIITGLLCLMKFVHLRLSLLETKKNVAGNVSVVQRKRTVCILKKKIDARIDAVSRMAKLGNIRETDTLEA